MQRTVVSIGILVVGIGLLTALLFDLLPGSQRSGANPCPVIGLHLNQVASSGVIDTGCDSLFVPVADKGTFHIAATGQQISHAAWGDEQVEVASGTIALDLGERVATTDIGLYRRNPYILIGNSVFRQCRAMVFLKGRNLLPGDDKEIARHVFRGVPLLPIPCVAVDGTHTVIIDTGSTASAYFAGCDPTPIIRCFSGKGITTLTQLPGKSVWRKTPEEYPQLTACIGVIGQDVLQRFIICIDGKDNTLEIEDDFFPAG